MENREVAVYLQRIAELLLLKGENEYKVRAYQQAARVIYRLDKRVEELVAQKSLKEIKGIGNALAAKIEEIIITGQSHYLKALEAEVPLGLLALFSLPGVGPKNASLLVKNLDIKTMDDLESAAQKGLVQKLPGMGPALERNIIDNIQRIKLFGRRSLLSDALMLVDGIHDILIDIEGVKLFACSGELRRGKETVKEISMILGVDNNLNKDYLQDILKRHTLISDIGFKDNQFNITTIHDIPTTIYLVEEKDFVIELLYQTGSASHLSNMEKRALELDFLLSRNGLFKGKKQIHVEKEEEIYQLLELPYIPPEIREGDNEIIRALEGAGLPLIEKKDVSGDLHIHSNWSDGHSSIPEIAEYAQRKGYKYIAITDHSQSLKIAGGLSVEKLREQISYIKDLRKKVRDLHIFTGIEVDILKDGSLDFTDDILSEPDVVIASIHSGFNQTKQQITHRILSAIQNPYVNIIAHLSGRLIGRREPYEIDTGEIFKNAAETGTFLEINASPDRLDLRDVHIKQALMQGVSFVINTDSHGINNMDDMDYGIITARRGALTKQKVLNTHKVESVISLLGKGREMNL